MNSLKSFLQECELEKKRFWDDIPPTKELKKLRIQALLYQKKWEKENDSLFYACELQASLMDYKKGLRNLRQNSKRRTTLESK